MQESEHMKDRVIVQVRVYCNLHASLIYLARYLVLHYSQHRVVICTNDDFPKALLKIVTWLIQSY